MRIIAGRFRGRRLSAPAGRTVRPTGDRMKESMYSALGEACRGAGVLDLFSGSGALGLEALSRGALRVTFVERERASRGALEQNIAALGVESECRVVGAEVTAFLARESGEGYSLVLADPPYAGGLARSVLEWWFAHPWPGAILLLEYESSNPPQHADDPLEPLKTRSFGAGAYSIYRWPSAGEEA